MARYADLKRERDEAIERAVEAERLSMKAEVDRIRAECAKEVQDAQRERSALIAVAMSARAALATGIHSRDATASLHTALYVLEQKQVPLLPHCTVWGIGSAVEPEDGFTGAYPTREAAIVAGRGKYEGVFWVRRGEYGNPWPWFSIERFLGQAEESAQEDLGTDSQALFYAPEAVDELRELVLQWVRVRVRLAVLSPVGAPERIDPVVLEAAAE